MSVANKIKTIEAVKDDIKYLRDEYAKTPVPVGFDLNLGKEEVTFENIMQWLEENKEFVRLANKSIEDLKGFA